MPRALAEVTAALPCSGTQGRLFENQVFRFERRALRHEAEYIPAFRAFIVQHVVPVLDRLNANQRSFEIAGHADRCRSHFRRLVPVMVVEFGALYRGDPLRRLI